MLCASTLPAQQSAAQQRHGWPWQLHASHAPAVWQQQQQQQGNKELPSIGGDVCITLQHWHNKCAARL
jgi:hypothetical protein